MTTISLSDRRADAEARARARQNARLARERRRRIEATKGQEDLLAQLDPPIVADYLTGAQVCEYLGISRSALLAITRAHREELKEVGFIAGDPRTPSRFSRRAVLHVALILRVSTSARGREIKRALGMSDGTRESMPRQSQAAHVSACRAVLDRASEVAEAVQDIDPSEVWADLEGQDRWTLQAMIVALGAMLPLDQPGLRKHLNDLGRQTTSVDRQHTADARGLALLVPPRVRLEVAQ